MVDDDPRQRLRDYIFERWAVIQSKNARFRSCTKLHHRLEDVTPREAEWFLEAVIAHESEPPLFRIEDDNKHRSLRDPPNRSGAPKGSVFFEKSGDRCSLRLETIVHQAAVWRLHDEFGWPLDHLVVESPDILDERQAPLLRREALDILVLEAPWRELSSTMSITAARTRVAVEAKADRESLARLLGKMQDCQEGRFDPDDSRHRMDHKKCKALDVLRPRCFLGVAANETWRVFTVLERDGRAAFAEELRTLDCLHE